MAIMDRDTQAAGMESAQEQQRQQLVCVCGGGGGGLGRWEEMCSQQW